MPMVRAKMRCESVLQAKGQECVKLEAVSGPGNESWSKWTPMGGLTLTITNPDARGKFEPGTEYYVDILEIAPVEAK